MSEIKVYPVPADFAAQANVNDAQYQEMYQRSISDPEGFWSEQADQYISWFKKWDKALDWSFGKDDLHIEWFKGAKLNVSYNCLDRHLESRGDQVAIIWEGDNPDESRNITYRELHQEVCKFANVLKSRGVNRGDRVSLYLPMIPEAAVAMLACTRIGAVHSIVFGGFSPDALRDRILDSDCKVVITSDQSMRGGKKVPLKANADKSIAQCPNVHTSIVVQRGGDPVEWDSDRDVWYHEAMADASDDCPAEEMEADDPLFILYTSGSTGKPKGVLHTTGGYLLQAAMTHKLVFDYKDGEVYWCTADVGWVTGHTYIVYGPLANGATTLMFEGIPTYPDISRFWQVCDKHNVSTFYTAPTAIRSLMGAGEEPVKKTSRSSLRLLGTVGEPINPEAWEWYYHVVGDERCPIVDTWWQTETGAHMLTPLPGATPLKPGSATRPFFGVDPVLLDDQGNEIEGNPAEGNLAIKQPWPSMMRTVYGDHKRFFETYFAMYPGYYFTGDGARRDEDGYYWITGRVDDVLNVSGHRLGTAEIESALVLHDSVAEAAVVGYPHDLTGQGIYAYVTLMAGIEGTDELKTELVKLVRSEIGPIAKVNLIQWSPGLPKTRSGKIMRRILRKIAANELDTLGDTSTLADPSVVDNLIDNRENK
ncbi:MAG: acetate--CoA ligase [Candidatus Thiodiazotropha taylori]|uniref:Acetyl-coenzyme A synthetase n=1 Tax=Candidatus Thiodiazotropha taylori TaxID=2792791 RepID=A0A9E4PXU1_9GAMM|nr:acetate--CoA ligase [Candidatus Thiodiazotropha taylori]RLW68157.1 MAG: acetate--CoA ligase [gamma proteobacterium symbiont of Stewartia floridana]MCG7965345.1 acetate--CoA ligase [Candidatus Thiodiazotropha taylori]MCG8027242.1 acetate--CoA ligase [Candidatus Thiodiazotropha taylori]MCG8042042.1 acetate--CoA ligase [Candidatus Thiodiazotropha taylori]